ncbi:MAG: hypothetical protein M9894_32220 [Planctomycetes bacterium]|nr:hypothetical protein [Planctomycetota bacterium]
MLAAIRGSELRRRRAALQVNFAYVVLVSSQFQGYCRSLHSEAVDHLTTHLSPPQVRAVVRRQLVIGRRLDAGNPNPGNLGADFGRLGLDLWPALESASRRIPDARHALEALNAWRNAIAHQDLDPARLGGRTSIGVAEVRRWRRACSRLATALDHVIRAHLRSVVGDYPWK